MQNNDYTKKETDEYEYGKAPYLRELDKYFTDAENELISKFNFIKQNKNIFEIRAIIVEEDKNKREKKNKLKNAQIGNTVEEIIYNREGMYVYYPKEITNSNGKITKIINYKGNKFDFAIGLKVKIDNKNEEIEFIKDGIKILVFPKL